MPPPEGNDREQMAVLWPPGSFDDYGQPLRGSPVEVEVRWSWNTSQTRRPSGETVATMADVVVPDEVALGSLMFLGTLDEWCGTGSSEQNVLMEVVDYAETPDVKGREFERTVKLAYYRDTPPETE